MRIVFNIPVGRNGMAPPLYKAEALNIHTTKYLP